ncbi:MAG: type 4a pilus biogenesis protein PilO [Hylemonella sp.]|uniref:type 4a pilus biogenesis protein PilO n=1 Tax=Hylemonella sp. TaxID=2066020 RepID=UPI0022BDF87B|nr:type 4a pilus biogenesis protein PilO [Hylemonella sp.]MCZ8253783.1 type 4a pilus biogenesis protein PilO [Hylemonella sp.]
MAATSSLNQKFAQLQETLRSQFSNLDPRNPVVWPALPRYGLFLFVAIVVVVVLWFVWLSGEDEILTQARAKETQLREEYRTKLAKAINLDALRKQREQVLQYVTQLEKQLPSKAEMDALLSDINQAGLGRSLQFELFRPGQIVVRDYYAELPITLKVTGRFHDIGSFTADVAHLSRIVTLNNLTVTPRTDGSTLTMDATAKTFRYLDQDEIAAQRKTAGGRK